MSKDDTEVKEENKTPGQESSTDDKKEQVDGSQPDLKAQLEDLQGKVSSFEKRAKHSEEVTKNMQNALQVERNKRKAAQGKPEETSEYDPSDMANFKKAAKAAGILTKDDLDQIQAKKSQEEATQKNTETFQGFITKNKVVFGVGDEATPEQEKNLKVFSTYLNEYFDINKTTIANAKNLTKKLTKALDDLKGKSSAAAAETRGADNALSMDKNNVLLSVGAGGSGSTTEDESWKYGTPKAEAIRHLKNLRYSDKEIKEMLETAKK